jgi:hypothetical protein
MKEPINDSLALLATSYRVVISIAGAWLTARLAPDKPMKHALILGVVGTFLGLVGVVATWNQGLGPRWYPVLLAGDTAVLGGREALRDAGGQAGLESSRGNGGGRDARNDHAESSVWSAPPSRSWSRVKTTRPT